MYLPTPNSNHYFQTESSRSKGHVDWKRQIASAVARVAVRNSVGVNVVTHDLVGRVKLISKSRGCPGHCERCDYSVQANEGRLRLITENDNANKVAGIVNSQWDRVPERRRHRTEEVWVDQLITVKRAIAFIQVFADDMASVVNASALSQVPGVVQLMNRVAEVAVSELVNKTLNCPAGVDYSANGV